MSIRVIIANDNDVLYNSLSNISMQYESKIEVINVPTDKLDSFICQIKHKENLIVLDSNSSIIFYENILKNAFDLVSRKNIIILVIDSKSITNTINHEKTHCFFKTRHIDFSLLDTIKIITDSIRDTLEVERQIDQIIWDLNFTPHLKGTKYIKDAINFAYENNSLREDTNALVIKVAEKHGISNEKVVRSAMDKSLNNMLDFTDESIIYKIFENDYDGRKISLKYFIDLSVRYLEKQRYCCLDY